MKKLLLLLIAFTLFVNCEEKKEQPVEPVKEETVKTPSKLQVSIEYKSDVTDIIQCVFSTIEIEDSSQIGNYYITQNTPSSDTFKTYDFDMFGDYLVSKVQLKLGKNPKTLDVKKIRLSYEDREVIVSGKDVAKYFVKNAFVKINAENQTIETVTVKGKHTPVLTLRQGFINRLFNLK